MLAEPALNLRPDDEFFGCRRRQNRREDDLFVVSAVPGYEFPTVKVQDENVGIPTVADFNLAFLVLHCIGVKIMRNSDVAMNDDG